MESSVVVRVIGLLGLLALAGMLSVWHARPAPSATLAVMRLDPDSFKVTGGAGTPFTVNVLVDGVTNLGAFEFVIQFDPSFVKLGGIRTGPFLGSSGRTVSCAQRAVGLGAIAFRCNTTGPLPAGPAGSGVVASLDFFVQGFAFGQTSLLLTSCQTTDVLGNAIPLTGCLHSNLAINPPPGNPRLEKLPALRNLFLTRQGAKIPPATCLGGSNVALFVEALSSPILQVPDPKNPSQNQQLGAFQFEVRYDQKLVCVQLVAGPAAAGMICTIQDSLTAPALKGLARIGCVTPGKSVFPDTTTEAGRHLADLIVRPQPQVYSQMRPNQNNGIVAQLMDQGCQLADLQGHPITLFSCDSAAITFRYLEGDVAPNCAVNVLDAQQVAFRWGAQQGSLLYDPFFDVVPSGQVTGDGRIDINDLQFVYGRLGSTCPHPWPPQPPVNPKAGPTTTPALAPTPTPTLTGTPTPRINKSPNLLSLPLSSPPATQRCEDSTDTVTFNVVLKDAITSPDPKSTAHLPQQLGAFEFATYFDPSRVCIDIAPGQIPLSGMNCMTQRGAAFVHFGCTTMSKASPPTQPPGVLAVVTVRPQPALYSLIPPGQGQEIVTQLFNQNCQLADLQGHPIPSSSCSGATVVISHP